MQGFGQSVWLDYLRRSLFTSGEFSRLITEDGLRGVTSNPSIFEKAIAGSTDYLDALQDIERRRDLEPMALYEALAIRDIREAADLLRPVYDATGRVDGYVSLEVSPYLAHDTAATIEDARRLWKAVGRDNLMIKVPGTAEGVPAIRQLISEGINVNITLLFGVGRYADVATAYIEGLSTFVEHGGDAAKMGSVASFFVSRIDTMVDAMIAKRLATVTDASVRSSLTRLLGTVAIANAKLAYQRYLEFCGTAAWQRLAAKGAHPQRLLWASTSTKNPQYRDVRYVEELIGRDTVNTIPPATLEAFRDHGRPRASLEEGVEARATSSRRSSAWAFRSTTSPTRLVEDGVDAVQRGLRYPARGRRYRTTRRAAVDARPAALHSSRTISRPRSLMSWPIGRSPARRGDCGRATPHCGPAATKATGWTGSGSPTTRSRTRGPLKEVARDVAHAGVSHAVLLGMGGSSLCPEVMRKTFGTIKGFPELHVLDSTDPAQIAAIEHAVDLTHTLFIVSSKSGTTLEPNILLQYFLTRVKGAVGEAHAGGHFIAITDPDSALHHLAERERFRQVFFGVPGIGGRYSALSNFGMVPAALMGVDVGRLLDRTELMVHSCAASVPAEENPAVVLGAILGTLAAAGRDKVTFITSPGISDLGAWLEQLIAESTGKQGKGLIPVDREPLGSSRRLRSRSALRVSAAGSGSRSHAGRRSRRTGARGTAGGAHRALPTSTTSARNSSAGRWPRRWPARSSASIHSISLTWKRAKSRRTSSPLRSRRPGCFRPRRRSSRQQD